MHGDWCEKLPRTLCTLSRSVQQPLDPVLPPVLAFRCVTEDDINAVNDEFHESSFEAEETCVEVYEYRCSNPVVLVIAVDVKGYDYDPHRSSLFFLCIDDVGEIVDKIQLTVSDDRVGCASYAGLLHFGGSGGEWDFPWTFNLYDLSLLQEGKRMLVETAKAFVDPSAMMAQMRGDSDFWSLSPLTILCWRKPVVITKHPEDGHGIAQMDNNTARLITF